MKQGWRFMIGSLVAGALAVTLVLIAAGSQGALAQAGSIIYVDVDAVGRDDGTTWRNAYTDLQDALDAAQAGDEIWVAAGIYRPSRRLIDDDARSATFQMVNGVVIFGGFDPGTGAVKFADRDWVANVTILSGNIGDLDRSDDNSYHVFYHPEELALGNSAVLDGATITAGNATAEDLNSLLGECGAGMLSDHASPTLTNITFAGNSAVDGGALCVSAPSPEEIGGLTLTNVAFEGNSAVDGGALFITNGEPDGESSKLTLTNITFLGNSAVGDGGAVYIDAAQADPGEAWQITFANCIFSDNDAVDGGAVSIDAAQALPGDMSGGLIFTNCIFQGNVADRGGAVFTVGGKQLVDQPPLSLTNCIFWDNYADLGGAVFLTDTLPFRVTNCTFSDNVAESGGGIYVGKGLGPGEGWLELTNSILWGDTEDEIYLEDGVGLPIVTYSDIEGGYWGDTNIDADPVFVDPDAGDLHLQAGSPCIDFGDNDAPDLPVVDFDGQPRILDGNGDGLAVVDTGVDEYKIHPIIQVEIEVSPYIPSNIIKLRPGVVVDVAILSTNDFDAVDLVAPDMVEFGGAMHVGFTFVDVNGDGRDDVLLDFMAEDMVDLDENSTEATLTGETQDGVPFEGTAEVKVR